jgi:hypothetical protein
LRGRELPRRGRDKSFGIFHFKGEEVREVDKPKMTKEEAIKIFAAYAVPKVFEALLNVGRQSEAFRKGFHKKFVTEYKELDKERQNQFDDAIKIISKRR